MVTETTPQQRLAATLYIEFINLLLQLVSLMLIGSAVLVPLNWQYGDQSGDFFERCALTDKLMYSHELVYNHLHVRHANSWFTYAHILLCVEAAAAVCCTEL